MSRRHLVLLSIISALVVAGCVPAAPATDPGSAPAAQTWRNEMLGGLNAQRASVGEAPLRSCPTLNAAADAHSADQASHNRMSHTGSDGSNPGTRIVRAGYTGHSGWGENVAAGQPSPGAVMAAWMGSTGHRANILNGSFGDVGMGLAHSANGTPYWTQVFSRGGAC